MHDSIHMLRYVTEISSALIITYIFFILTVALFHFSVIFLVQRLYEDKLDSS